MRQPSFGGSRGPRAQAGFQKASKEQRATLQRMFTFVMKHYRWAIVVVLACVFISSITQIARKPIASVIITFAWKYLARGKKAF